MRGSQRNYPDVALHPHYTRRHALFCSRIMRCAGGSQSGEAAEEIPVGPQGGHLKQEIGERGQRRDIAPSVQSDHRGVLPSLCFGLRRKTRRALGRHTGFSAKAHLSPHTGGNPITSLPADNVHARNQRFIFIIMRSFVIMMRRRVKGSQRAAGAAAGAGTGFRSRPGQHA